MTFYIYTLGCKVNSYESNIMSESLIKNGYIKGTEENSDIYIINTCSVTNKADNKSLKIIRSAIRKNDKAMIIVVGCLSQIKYEEIKKIKNVSIILGNKDKSKIVDYIKNYKSGVETKIYDLNNQEFENMKLDNFDKTRAFVKIQDGCNNYCSYCIIPYTRGNVRSKEFDTVLDEIKCLIKNNHQEIVLTGIHTGHYKDKTKDLSDLINSICKLDGIKRLRISSIEITELNEKFLKTLENNEILVDHLHIPLQSGTNKTLKEMNRKYDIDYFKNKINEIRKIRPSISITTDVIVGFPGESNEDFDETIKNIKEINFSKLHVFPYSKRDNTKAATMKNQISEEIKKQRVNVLLELSKKLELDYYNKFINEEVVFIPEIFKDGYIIGHTGNYLLIKTKGNEKDLNKQIKVKLTNIEYPYLIGIK